MRLTIATPVAVVLQRDDIAALRAEDESGAFGILPGHAPFLTALTPSVVSWRDAAGQEGHCAVRGGQLTVRNGQEIAIATREAFLGDDIARLEETLRHEIAAAAERERSELHGTHIGSGGWRSGQRGLDGLHVGRAEADVRAPRRRSDDVGRIGTVDHVDAVAGILHPQRHP